VIPHEDGDDDTGGLPAQQTWYPARRRLFVALFATFSVCNIVLAILWSQRLATEPSGVVVAVTVAYGALAVVPAIAAWKASSARIVADAHGLHVVDSPAMTTYPWADITEIRPSILKGRRTYLVLVQRAGPTIDLPVTEEQLDALRRWHQTFA
jgi:hypothetical protein